MKRFFTFLMAVWALLSISQTVKAADVTVYFQCPSDWTAPVHAYVYNTSDHFKEWAKTDECTLVHTSKGVELWKYSFDSRFTKVIFQNGDRTAQTDRAGFDVTDDNLVYTSGGSAVTLSEFEKNPPYIYTLSGGYGEGTWSNESSNFVYDGTSKYTYTFTATQTGKFCFRVNTNYKKEKKEDQIIALCPEVKGQALTNEPVDVSYTNEKNTSEVLINENNYWTYNVIAGREYTFTLSEKYNSEDNTYSRQLSVVPEKTIQLLNAGTAVKGSKGKYTLDLSGKSSTDATITLTIDDVSYGLATAQTISEAGITTGIAFTAGGVGALTLKAGLIYSLTVTKDGKMTVVAREKSVADINYYLVGNFFDEDMDKINYDKKYFRFINSKGNGTLSIDIPASLRIKAQVYTSDGTCYGPVSGKTGYGISNTHPTAAAVSVNGDLVAGSNYWTFAERGLEETGIYTITITVDAAGTPTKWNVTYDKSKRMAYFLVDPKEDPDAVVHPTYAVVKEDRSCSNNFFGNIYLEAGQHCFVVGNLINGYDDDVTGHPVKTTKKLYLQGNGGLDPTMTVQNSERAKYTNVLPNKKEGFTYNETKVMLLEYSPTRGNRDTGILSGNNGICGEILKSSSQITDEPITSVQIVGDGVVGSWNLEDAKKMTYNNKLDCWEYTFKTDKIESADNKFRFIANGSWKYNWGEESTNAEDQARIPYKDKTKAGHEASLNDPNLLGFTTKGTAENRDGEGTYGDMIFNRPAGVWTIRLFTRTLETEDGNGYVAKHACTITGSESNDVILTYCNGQFIRTYSNNKAMNPVDDNVKIYEVYRYDKPAEETVPGKVDNIYAKGTVHLRRLNYIPANVGVVLIGVAPEGTYHEDDQLAFSLLERTEDPEILPNDSCSLWMNAETYIQHGDKWNNYLVPTVQANNNLGNAYVDKSSGNITYRYFGLSNYYRTKYHKSLGTADTQPDYLGFFRLTSNGKSLANRAYLSIPANKEVGNGVGATYGYLDFNGQLLENQYHEKYEGETPAKFANMAMIFDDLIEGNETTGIKELETEVLNDNKYYNLQGIEVAYPVKGIYIHNGKKVIVK